MDAKAAGQLIGAAGVGIYKAVRGLIRKAPSDDRSDRSSVDIELVEKSKSTPTPKTKKPGKVTLTDPFVPPADVQHGSTLHRATEIKTALTDYADALDATSDQLARAQAQLSKDPPNFKQAKLDVEAMATDMLSNDLRNLQEGLGLDRKALHGWLISADRTNEADPVASLKTFLTTQLQTAGHSAPQSAAMAGWLFDQIMVAGSVCLTAQTADHNTFKTYLGASVTHIHEALRFVGDGAAVDRLMSSWASARGNGVQEAHRAYIDALRQQAMANAAPIVPDSDATSSRSSGKPATDHDRVSNDSEESSEEDTSVSGSVAVLDARDATEKSLDETEESVRSLRDVDIENLNFRSSRGNVGSSSDESVENPRPEKKPETLEKTRVNKPASSVLREEAADKAEDKVTDRVEIRTHQRESAEHDSSSSSDEFDGPKNKKNPPPSKKPPADTHPTPVGAVMEKHSEQIKLLPVKGVQKDKEEIFVLNGKRPETTKKSSKNTKRKPGGTSRTGLFGGLKSVLKAKTGVVRKGGKTSTAPVATGSDWGQVNSDGSYEYSKAGRQALKDLVQKMRAQTTDKWTTTDLVHFVDVLAKFPGDPFEFASKPGRRPRMERTENLAKNAREVAEWLDGLEKHVTEIVVAQ